jgi:hypothetical protein
MGYFGPSTQMAGEARTSSGVHRRSRPAFKKGRRPHGDDDHQGLGCARPKMSVQTVLLIIVILMLVGALPTWPHSRSWGYYPSGGLGLVLIVLLILMLL